MTLDAIWQVLYWVWVVSEVLVVIKTRTRQSAGNVRDRGSLLVLWITIGISMFAGIGNGKSNPPTIFAGAPWVRMVSLVVLVAGLAIRWTAILTLGKSFSVNVAILANQTVHKTGLYRLVRHPSYSGLLLIFAAIGIHTRSWFGLAILVVPTTAALLYRIHVEEAALGDAFGREYADYSAQTKRLIPGVY